MNTEKTLTKETAVSVAIGQRLSDLLNLKIGKDGKINTSWGRKTIKGLGSCIIAIVEDENERLKDY